MYANFPHDINRPESSFDDWWMSLDAWLDTAEGMAWLANMDDAESMRCAADLGNRPGLGTTWEGF